MGTDADGLAELVREAVLEEVGRLQREFLSTMDELIAEGMTGAAMVPVHMRFQPGILALAREEAKAAGIEFGELVREEVTRGLLRRRACRLHAAGGDLR